MGIEVVIIVAVVAIIGFWAYRQSSSSPAEAPPKPPQQEEGESEKKRRASSTEPNQNSQTLTGGSMPPPAPPAPPQSQAKEAVDGLRDDDDDDEYTEMAEEEPEPVTSDIKGNQSLGAASTSDERKKEKVSELDPDEIIDFMDKVQEEKVKLESETEDVLMFGDVDEEEIEEETRLDVTYPPPQPGKPEAPPTKPATTAHFSAFYPKEVQVENRYEVVIYAHAESMLEKIAQDAEKFKSELGGAVPQPRVAKQSKSLAHGSKITVMLESEELEFEPDTLTKTWHGDWTRYNFEFRPKSDLVDETAFVRASIMVLGFEIAKIKFAIEIVEPQMQAMAVTVDEEPTNPFAKAKMESTTTSGYEKIFISYSRRDKRIANAFKIMQEAAGHDVFFDVDDIRTGEDWQAAIARAIDTADYFQLFWSEHSASSEWCTYEWDYALNYRCKDDKCREFIRPVWWADPMPPPPDILGHLNFKHIDLDVVMQLDEK